MTKQETKQHIEKQLKKCNDEIDKMIVAGEPYTRSYWEKRRQQLVEELKKVE